MSSKFYNISQFKLNDTKIKLLYISSAKYEGHWHSTVHTHHFTELFYITKGNGRFIVDKDSFSIKKDDLVIVNPNIEHTETSNGTNPLEYIVLGIDRLAFSSDNEELQGNYSFYNYGDYKNEVLFYLKALLDEVESKEAHYEAVCQNLIEVLIINIIRRTGYNLSVTSSQKLNKECALIKRYIDDHFKDNITLDLLAELTHMNKYYLVHAFKKYMGISPINYLINRRVEESKILLETTNISIGEISGLLGFSSQSYFSQSFKKNTNQTPNGYRKAVRS